MLFFPETFTLEYNISQLLGFFALALVCVGYFCKKERLVIYQIFANLVIMISLIFLNATFGWISSLIAAIRFIVFYVFENKNKKIPVWFLCLITYLLVASCAIFGRGNYELLQMVALINFTFAFLLDDEVKLRIIILISCVYFLSYNLILYNFLGFIRCAIEFTIVFITLIVFIKKRKKHE